MLQGVTEGDLLSSFSPHSWPSLLPILSQAFSTACTSYCVCLGLAEKYMKRYCMFEKFCIFIIALRYQGLSHLTEVQE